MQTYQKNGFRKYKIQEKINVKKQVKEFYTRIKQINDLVNYLKTLKNKVTEDNIDLIVPELIGRNLDNIEKNIILNKLNETENNS